MKKYFSLVLLTLTLLLSVGCSSDDTSSKTIKTPPPEKPIQKSVVILKGVIVDPSGAPLSDVQVSSASVSTTTAPDGSYVLSIDSTETTVSVTATLKNYTHNSRSITLSTLNTLNITIAPIDLISRFDAEKGTIVKTKGASVALPNNGYVTTSGTPFTGEVTAKVSYNKVTTTTGAAVFPGEFIGLEVNGSTTGIISYGFIDVTLEDASGNPLKLAQGKTATLTYPADPSITAHPTTIPLWYYDTIKGIWVEDGLATYNAATNSYSGTVSHFTTWNLDAKFDGASVQGCVEDITGTRLSIADLYVSTPGWSKHVTNKDANGAFTFINAPSNKTMSLIAKLNGKVSTPIEFTLTPGQKKVLENCLIVDINATDLFATVTGSYHYSDGKPLVNSYVSIKNGNRYLDSVSTDENGSFTSRQFVKKSIKKITTSTNVHLANSYIDINEEYLLSEYSSLTNLGDTVINVAHVMGCVEQNDGNTSFIHGGTISIDTPYSYNGHSFDNEGFFDFYMLKNNQEHTIYSYNDTGRLECAPRRIVRTYGLFNFLGKTTMTSDRDTIDLTSSCIVVSEPVVINKDLSIAMTSSREDAYISVVYRNQANYQYPYPYGEGIFDGQETLAHSTSVSLTKNGVYYIFQLLSNYDDEIYDGTINVTVDDVIHTITIPTEATACDGWAAFAIEVFQGEVKVIKLNIPTECS